MYIPLRVFSPFSVGFGAVRTNELAEFCHEHAIPAAGIADINTLSGTMANAKELRSAGIQPLTGATVSVMFYDVCGPMTFYAKSSEGYAKLLRVMNCLNTKDVAPVPIDFYDICSIAGADANQIIVLTGGEDGLFAKLSETQQGKLAQALKSSGMDAYVEIERNSADPYPYEAGAIACAMHNGLPVVATSRAAYATPEMCDAHDVFLCISNKTYVTVSDRISSQEGWHLATPEEMAARFSDLPNAIENTLAIARKCAHMIEPVKPHTPAYPVEKNVSEQDTLRHAAKAGLKNRLKKIKDANTSAYEDRLAYELDIIVKMGFAGYFLIVADFIGWSKSKDIPVGPGRGSGAGSLVAYALDITDIDPIVFGLLFERFLNPERVSLPDFDVDFCQERRGEVIEYVRNKYGADKVAHICAFGSLQARAVVRAVGRVMQQPNPVVDRYAKMIPSNAETLTEAMADEILEGEIEKADKNIRAMFQTALKLEGLYSHVSTHAAGIIISDVPIQDVVPVHMDLHGKLATSYEMKAAESAGLVKFDFLGLKNLDTIHGAQNFISQEFGRTVDFDELNFCDATTYAKLATGDGFAVFQLESSGMGRAMRDLQVENIEELIALISLYRPGPMDQIPVYAGVKAGIDVVSYAHPEMEAILSETNGVMIYQEQVMQSARSLAGYSLADADLLRRAMGKKVQSEMDEQRDRFTQGASEGWVDVTLDNGETRRLHARTMLPLSDGSGTNVSLQEALEGDLDVNLAA